MDILQQGFNNDDSDSDERDKKTSEGEGDLQKEVAEMLSLNALLHGGEVEDQKSSSLEGMTIKGWCRAEK